MNNIRKSEIDFTEAKVFGFIAYKVNRAVIITVK